MDDGSAFISVSIVAILGQMFTLGVFTWQLFSNIWGFWFWFSLASVLGYGISVAALRDIDNLIKMTSHKTRNKKEVKK